MIRRVGVLEGVHVVRWITLAAAIFITVAALSSCGDEEGGDEEAQISTTPPTVTTKLPATTTTAATSGRRPTRHDVVGTWATAGEALLWVFTPDGRFAFDRVDLDNPYARGAWKLEGRTITLAVGTALGTGCVGEWSWRAGIVKGTHRLDDELKIVFLEEGCGRIAGTKMTLARIET
jgi:hypothetical protein